MAVFSLQGGDTRQAPGLRGRLLAAVTDVSGSLGFEPRLQFEGSIDDIANNVADQLVPVLREALSNIARHAGAKNVRVSVRVGGDEVTMTVADDGVGVPEEVLGGRGLVNMAERARLLGGECSVANKPDGGALVTFRVPVVDGASVAEPEPQPK